MLLEKRVLADLEKSVQAFGRQRVQGILEVGRALLHCPVWPRASKVPTGKLNTSR